MHTYLVNSLVFLSFPHVLAGKQARRLYSAVRDQAYNREFDLVDEWVDSLSRSDLNYFFNLIQNGYTDHVMDVFRADQGMYGDYYDAYNYLNADMMGDAVPPVSGVNADAKKELTKRAQAFPTEWMGYLPDATKLTEITTPGTHDTMVCTVFVSSGHLL